MTYKAGEPKPDWSRRVTANQNQADTGKRQK